MAEQKTLQELHVEERDYLLGKSDTVPTTKTKVSTAQKQFEAEQKEQIEADERLYDKQRKAQAVRNQAYAEANKLPDPNTATTIVANKVVAVNIAPNTEKAAEPATNSKEAVSTTTSKTVSDTKPTT